MIHVVGKKIFEVPAFLVRNSQQLSSSLLRSVILLALSIFNFVRIEIQYRFCFVQKNWVKNLKMAAVTRLEFYLNTKTKLHHICKVMIYLVRSQNFPKNNPCYSHARVFTGVRNVNFLENFASVLNGWCEDSDYDFDYVSREH